MAKHNDIVNAIADKKKVYISYQGGKRRKVEMFLFGKHISSNNDVVRVWQQSGESESDLDGGSGNWRLLIADDIESIDKTETDVNIKRARNNGYKEDDSEIKPVYAKYTENNVSKL
jgi:hypothetical protein